MFTPDGRLMASESPGCRSNAWVDIIHTPLHYVQVYCSCTGQPDRGMCRGSQSLRGNSAHEDTLLSVISQHTHTVRWCSLFKHMSKRIWDTQKNKHLNNFFFILNAIYLIYSESHRVGNRLLLRLLGVTVLPFRTLDTLAGLTQSRNLTVGTIGTRNGVGILWGK